MSSLEYSLATNPQTQISSQISKSADRKLYKLEAIRGFAAVYVALGHTFINKFIIGGHNLSFILRFGQEAVILFFLLSGFVIQYSHTLSKDKSFKTFFFKRFLRIYIPLIAFFFLNYFFLNIEKNRSSTIDGLNLICNLGMFQDASFLKPNVLCDCFLGNEPLWSLSYEWWFYMLFFAITATIKTNISKVVYSLSLIGAITYIIYPNFFNREIMYFAIWWVGADIAKLYLSNAPISLKSLSLQIAILFIIAALLAINIKINVNPTATIGMSPFLEFRHFTFALIAVVCVIIWRKMHWIAFEQTIGLFTFIAPISFGIYISHWFLIAHAHYLDGIIANEYLKYIIYTIVCVAFAYLIERVIYVYLNRWVMRILNRSKQGE